MKTYRQRIHPNIEAEKVILKNSTTAFEVFGIKFSVAPYKDPNTMRMIGMDDANCWRYDHWYPAGEWWFIRDPQDGYLTIMGCADFKHEYVEVKGKWKGNTKGEAP